jgi:two-component system, sensor histidine kinase PdtaS
LKSKIKIFRNLLAVIVIATSIQNLGAQNQREADSLIILINNDLLDDSVGAIYFQMIAIRHGQASEGLFYAQKFLEKAKKMNNLSLQAQAYEEISLKHRILGNNVKAFDAAFQALSIYEKLNLTTKQAATFIQIGSNYIIDKEYDQAVRFLSKALIINTSVSDTFNTALTHINLGEAYRLEPDLDSATYHFKQALVLNEALHDEIIEGYALGNLGMVQVANGETKTGIAEMEKAIKILNKLGDNYSVSVYKAEIGKALVTLNQAMAGEQYMLEGLELAKAENLKEQIRDISGDLSLFYETSETFDKSLFYQKQFQVYQDSLVNKENIQKIEQIKSQYELDKKESEIQLLNELNNAQRQLAYLLSGGVILFIVLAILLFLNNRQRKRTNSKLFAQKEIIESREKEKALLLKELNHRVKNNLQMVSSLLNLQSQELSDHPAIEAIRAGRYRVEAMSLIHQKLYQEDHHTQIAMKDYIEELVRNLIYSYGKEVDLELNVTSLSVDIDYAIPMALIINELVTNALKYAYDDVDHPKLAIHLFEDGSSLHLKVEDNGIGWHKVNLEKTDSFGLKLVHSLADQLDGKIVVSNGNGTHWHLSITPENT